MATRIWNGGGGNDNWSTAANWGVTGVPVAGDDIQFGGSTRLTPNNDLTADTSFASITFNSGAGAFTLGGNRITLGGTIAQNSATAQTISMNLVISTGRNISINSGSLTISGIISGAGLITLGGGAAFTLTLSGANTAHSGGITVAGGALLAATSDSSLGTGTITLDPTGVRISISDGLTVANNIVVNGGVAGAGRGGIENTGTGNATITGTIHVTAGMSSGGILAGRSTGTLTLAGQLSHATPGGIINQRAGTVIYSGGGTNNYQLNITGTGRIGAVNGISTSAYVLLGTSASSTLDVRFNQSLARIGRAANTIAITNNATSTDTTLTLTGPSTSYSGSFTDGATSKVNVVIASGGAAILSGVSTGTGTMTVDGTLIVNSPGSLAAGMAVTVNSGGRLEGSGTISGTTTVKSGGTISPGDGSLATLTTGSVTVEGGGTLAVSLDGVAPSADLLAVTGTLTLQASSLLSVESLVNSSIGDIYTINTSSVTVSGNFSGLADGATFVAFGRPLRINYPSGTSITLTDITPVGMLMMPFFHHP